MRRRVLRTGVAALAAAAALGVASCSGVTYAQTPVPTPAATSTSSGGGSSTTPVVCSNPTQSYNPLSSVPPTSQITDQRLRRIIDRGHLIVGVSADTYLFGARNPFNGQIEGFDIDIARAVATSLLGSASKLQLRVITTADRIPLLEKGEVDMVVRIMSMTCDRWKDIAFSSEYYRSGQKLLVAKRSKAVTLADMKGKRVCAPAGSTSLTKLRTFQGVIPVVAANHTGCLVLFQQGKVDGITGDDTVLAGLAAQDPYAGVTKAAAITAEPYGIGFNKADIYFVRYVNALLAEMRSDGRWKAIYNKWLATTLGPAPAPPAPVYGR
jgi:polar amino acid transport system substrate-binding protein